ncbi:MAG: tetratricopeptide repeat protein [Myxococcales bacterium]|nr:tetratricopeptide repeat protein [Myxococcales bacterium]
MSDDRAPFDLFLTHAPADSPDARAFADRLRLVGLAPWLVEEQLGHEVHPEQAVPTGFNMAPNVVVWLTESWLAQPWANWELDMLRQASEAGRRLVPILHVAWEESLFGPYLSQGLVIPNSVTEDDERLWLVYCAVYGQAPGPREMWQSNGHALLAQDFETKHAHAQALANGGDLYGAADLYSDVIDANPDHVAAHIARGRLYLDLGDFARAMSDFTVAEELAADDPEPRVAMGDLYFARKDYVAAIDYYDVALEVLPSHAMAFCRRGMCHYYRKNYPEALQDLEAAERLDAEIPNLMTYVAMARKRAGRRRR